MDKRTRSILLTARKAAANIGVYGSMTVALLAAAGAFPLTPLIALATSVGASQFSDLLSRIAQGEDIPVEELAAPLQDEEMLRRIGQVIEEKLRDHPDTFAFVLRESAEIQLLLAQAAETNLRLADFHSAFGEHTVETRQAFKAIDERLTVIQSAVAPADGNDKSPAEDGELAGRINAAATLIDSGQFSSAREILLQVRVAIRERDASETLKFRVAANLGNCAYALEEYDEAVSEFDRAHEHKPTDPTAITLAGLAALLKGDHAAALELSAKALAADERAENAASIHLSAIYELRGLSATEAFAASSPWVLDVAQCCLTMSEIFRRESNLAEAERYARLGLDKDPDSIDANMILAQVIVLRLQDEVRFREILAVGREEISKLQEAEAALSKVVDSIGDSGNVKLHNMALANRSGVRSRLGRREEAIRDCNSVLGSDPEHSVALFNKGMDLFRSGSHEEATSLFERITDAEFKGMARLPLAASYASAGQHRKVLDLLSPVFEGGSDNPERTDMAGLMLRAFEALGDNAGVQRMLDELDTMSGASPSAKGILASRLFLSGDATAAISLLQAAAEDAHGLEKAHLSRSLSYVEATLGNYAKAARILSPFVDRTVYSEELLRLAHLYFEADELREALAIARAQRERDEIPPRLAEIEALALYRLGDLDAASAVFQELRRREPENVTHLLHIAQIHIRRGDMATAVSTVEGIQLESVKDDADALINVARIRNFLQMPNAIEYAYKARRIAFEDPEVHSEYFRTCVMAPDGEDAKHFKTPEHVGIGSAVLVDVDGTETTLVVLDEQPLRPDRGEIGPDDARALDVLGKSVGDLVPLTEGLDGPKAHAIIAIKSKYLHALHETLALFSSGTYQHGALRALSVKDPGSKESFWASVASRDNRTDQIVGLYDANPVPIGTIAKAMHMSDTDAWNLLVSRLGARLHASSGNPEDGAYRKQVLESAGAASLDTTFLLTVVCLGCEEAVSARFKSLMVAQNVFDELVYAKMKYLGMKAFTCASSDGKQRVVTEVSRDHLDQTVAFYERAIAFVRDNAEVRPAAALSSADTEDVESIGDAALSAALLAQELGIPLASDDLRLRALAKHKFGVDGFWTLDVLDELRANEQLTEDIQHEALLNLICMNYRFVPISVGFLSWAFKKADFRLTPVVRRVLEELDGDNCDTGTAIEAVAKALWSCWGHIVLPFRQQRLLAACLSSLSHGSAREPLLVARVFVECIECCARSLWVIVPGRKEQITAMVRDWLHTQVIAVRFGETSLPTPSAGGGARADGEPGRGAGPHRRVRAAVERSDRPGAPA